MGANQNQQNQVYQIVAGNGLQTAPFGLPIGESYDPTKKATFGQKLMQGLGYAGAFAKGSMESGTPSLLGGLGGLGSQYNLQQYNQAQLKQQQDAMERARQAELQQQAENLMLANEARIAQGLPPIDPTQGTGGMRTSPEDVRSNLTYVGSALGNQAMVNETLGNGFNPQAGALLSESYITDRNRQINKNLTNMATLGKTSEALTAGAQAGGNVNTAGVPQSAITPTSNGDPFRQALGFVRKAEGGYANNPADKGGATNLGITQGTYNSWRKSNKLPSKDVKDITEGEATAIYKKNYWDASGAGKLAKTNPALAQVHFDTAVNMGVGRASQLLKMSGQDPNKYLAIRQQKYNEFAQNPSQKQFLEGWTNRNENLKKSIAGLQPQGKAPKSTVAQGNPQAQGQIMGSLNAYNTSPQLRRDAIQNPYQVAIADPDALMRGFGAGADTQNAVNNTNLNYRGQNIQQEQNKVSTALNYAQLAESKRQNDIQALQAKTNAEAVAMQKAQEAESKRVGQLEAQNTRLTEILSKKDTPPKQREAIQAQIDKNTATLGTIQTGLPFNQNGQIDFSGGWASQPQPQAKATPKQQAPKREQAPARVNQKWNPNTRKFE
jgi:hypothetical protein